MVCTNRISDFVGFASMMHLTSRSKPVVSVPTLQDYARCACVEATKDALALGALSEAFDEFSGYASL